jgi:hypothetical protein
MKLTVRHIYFKNYEYTIEKLLVEKLLVRGAKLAVKTL